MWCSAKCYKAERPMSLNGMVRPCSCPTSNRMLGRGAKDKEHAMSQTLKLQLP